MAITKESLIHDGLSANTAFLKLKQKYKRTDKKLFLVVEGKDDDAYYQCTMVRYAKDHPFEILIANNRHNVVETYTKLNWGTFDKNRILFFIDRDLSDITGEHSPVDKNVYITDDYSIENSLFSKELLLITLRIHYRIDLTDEDNEIVKKLYDAAEVRFFEVFTPIMCWILNWKIRGAKCNLNNLNTGGLFQINSGVFSISEEFRPKKSIQDYIHRQCNVEFVDSDLTKERMALEEHGGISKKIRGKYLRAFFVKFLNSLIQSSEAILPSCSKAKAITSIGYSNALQLLCGYMVTPVSLDRFLNSCMHTYENQMECLQ